MFAVMTTGGKQYRVEAGSELIIERVAGEPGASITFDRVLMLGDGDQVTVGTPTVAGASITATVIGETLGPKLVVFKFKQKVKYRRHAGHRQHLTKVRIDEITAPGTDKPRRTRKAAEPKTDEPKAEAAEPKADAAAAAEPEVAETVAATAPKRPSRARRAAPKAETEE
jgi:large subunit ribosomal protein L21